MKELNDLTDEELLADIEARQQWIEESIQKVSVEMGKVAYLREEYNRRTEQANAVEGATEE